MILLNGNSLEQKRKVPLVSMQLTLKERESTATIVPADASGIGVGSWLQDETNPGKNIVWRVKSISQAYAKDTVTVQLEHAIGLLKDRILFGEVTPKTITGNDKAKKCTAKQAVQYILRQQGDWVLGQFGYDVSNPYKFDGDTLFAALETVTDSLADAEWTFDMRKYPFTLHITPYDTDTDSILRPGRNLKTVTKTIDKSGMYTRFYPIGKDDLKLTGSGYVEKNASKYGVVSHVETDQSLDSRDELTRWANERLAAHAEPTVTIDVEGLELADATGESMDRLRLGQVCLVPLREFGTEIRERITALSYADKIRQPENVRVTLANNRTDVTKILSDEIKKAGKSSRSAAKKAKEDNAWFEDTNDHVAMCAKGIIGTDAQGNVNWYRLSQVYADGTGVHQVVTEVQNGVEKHETRLDQDETKIGLVVGTKNGKDFIKAAEIVASINKSTGESEAKIDADHVYIGNKKSTTVINGKLNASELNATKIKTLIGQIAVVKAQTIEAASLKFSTNGGSGGPYTSVRDLIDAYKIVKTGNNYKLQYKRLNSTSWYDAPDSETFSRATTLSGAWSGGTYTVTASPQGDTKSTSIHSIVVDEEIAPSGTSVRAYMKVYYATGNPSSPSANTGFTRQLVSLSGTEVYNNGKKAAEVSLSHGSVTTDSNYQKHVTYTASNTSNSSNKATKTLYLVKSGSKSQLREGSATGTLVMEINNT